MKHHVEAEITFIPSGVGGRDCPVYTGGYRPQFYYDGADWCSMHNYPDRDKVMPGETVKVLITLLSPEKHHSEVQSGKLFLVREGNKTVAYGIVEKVFFKKKVPDVVEELRKDAFWIDFPSEIEIPKLEELKGEDFRNLCLNMGFDMELCPKCKSYKGWKRLLFWRTIHHRRCTVEEEQYKIVSDAARGYGQKRDGLFSENVKNENDK